MIMLKHDSKMKKKYLIILLSLICLLPIQTALSQNLTFSDFMHITSIDNLSELNDYLSSKGYKYAGSISNNGKTMAYWANNITYSDKNLDGTFSWDFDNNSQYGVVEMEERNNSFNRVSYYFPSKNTYNSIMKLAEQDGYSFVRDGLDEDNIFKVYTKQNTNLDYIENLIFYERKIDGYFIQYYLERPMAACDSTHRAFNGSSSNAVSRSVGRPVVSGLDGYTLEYFPTANCPGPGTVVIRVTVSPTGNVKSATVTGGTLRSNPRACNICLDLAKQSRFKVPRGQNIDRTGTLTYQIR